MSAAYDAAWQAYMDRYITFARDEVAFKAGWDAAVEYMDSLDSPRLRTLCGEPRTIPARNTDPGTSHAATEEIKVRAGTQRAKLLTVFRHGGFFGVDGLTDEQAMEGAVGVSPTSEYAKRCSELREAGFIEPTGETRRGASGMERIVSRITDKGRAWVRDNNTDQSEQDWTTGPGGGRNT